MPRKTWTLWSIVANEAHPLNPLGSVLEWLVANGVTLEGEHAMIAGVPVQFLPAWHPLVIEAVNEAAEVPFQDATIRVIRPAYLSASWKLDPAANSLRRRERTARLIEAGLTTGDEIDALLARFTS